MKIAEARKKIKKGQNLLSEYNLIKATLRAIERSNKETHINLLFTEEEEKGIQKYTENLKKRLFKIELEFNNLLK